MPKVQLTHYEDFQPPDRSPWIVLAVVVVIGCALAGWSAWKKRAPAPEPDVTDAEVAAAPEITPSAPVRPSAPAASPAKPAPSAPSADVRKLVAEAEALVAQDKLPEARLRYLDALKQVAGTPAAAKIEDALGRIGLDIILTPRMSPEKVEYVVQSGDSLDRLSKKFNTTVDLIKTANQIANAGVIKRGDVLRLLNGKFRIEVSKTRNDLVVYMNDTFFKRYRIGTGKFGKTPLGTFVVTEKQKEPVWWPQGREVPYGHPDNILGTRWMAIQATGDTPPVAGYGIHGTWDDASIGKAESAGCVRMHNAEVEELYVYIPIGTPVTIVE